MKSLQNLILSHILVSIFVTFFLVYGHITRPFLIIFLLAPPKRISLLYPHISPTTDNEFYGLEISTISNHLYYF